MKRWLTVVFLCAITACSGDEEQPFPPNRLLLTVSPFRMYTAFGGSHTYSVAPSVSWVADDPQMAATLGWRVDEKLARIERFDMIPAAVKLTTRATGSTHVEVTGEFSGEAFGLRARLEITQANDEDWARGDTRFQSGPRVDLATLRARLEEPDLQAAMKDCKASDLISDLVPHESACASCHGDTGAAGMLPITPLQLASYSDEELIRIITQGEISTPGTFTSEFFQGYLSPDCLFSKIHAYSVDEADQLGLVLKLRSLAPQLGEHAQPSED